jgi:hypothetical protein
MDKKEIIEKIMQKPELKELPREDVEMAFSLCFKKEHSDTEQIRCTREILHRAYGAFGSRKLLIARQREPEWILKKHLSTRERLPYYRQIYDRILKNFKGTIFDLGAGVNGFSLSFVPNARYVGIEGIGQLVKLMNGYFKEKKLNAKAIHLSLFNLEKIKFLIKKQRGKKIIFLFKVLDSLESLKKDYSKKFLKEVTPLVDKVVVSFATRSMVSKRLFKAKRNWILDFIKDNFRITDDFEFGGERYVCFAEK